jgi:hypothetical protein
MKESGQVKSPDARIDAWSLTHDHRPTSGSFVMRLEIAVSPVILATCCLIGSSSVDISDRIECFDDFFFEVVGGLDARLICLFGCMWRRERWLASGIFRA